MKRYMLTPVVGNGDDTIDNPYRSSLRDISKPRSPTGAEINSIYFIRVNPDGSLKYNFCFVRAACARTEDANAAQQLLNSLTFPDYPLSGRMDGMSPSVRNAMVQDVQAYSLNAQNEHIVVADQDDESYQAVLTRIARYFEPAADLSTFDIYEPEPV